MSRSPFLDHIREQMYLKRYAYKTIKTYLYWIVQFIRFNQNQHPSMLTDAHVEAFLNYLVLCTLLMCVLCVLVNVVWET